MSDVDWEATKKKWAKKRDEAYKDVVTRLRTIGDLIRILQEDVVRENVEQHNENDWSSSIRNKTRYAADCRKIRRELLRVAKMLEES